MKNSVIYFFVFVLLHTTVFADGTQSTTAILDGYVNEALQSNLALQQKEFTLQKSIYALNEARALFLPSAGIEARYSRAGGGRTIDFPIGDLMNPVYESLNGIFTALGQQTQPYPVLENEEINFLRSEEHETKLRVVQPVFQPKIYFNYKIKSKLKNIEELNVQLYKRRLISDVKSAYFSYLKTVEVCQLLQSTQLLLKENVRVSQSLLDNQMATKETVLRAKSELAGIQQKIIAAENDKMLAASYFNFLLNRPMDAEILSASENPVPQMVATKEALYESAQHNREELQQLELGSQISSEQKKISGSSFFPQINFVGDFGYQGTSYKFDSQHDFWMVSGILQWNLFKGFGDYNAHQQAEMERKKLATAREELSNQIRLQVRQAEGNYQSAGKMLEAATLQEESAAESFRITRKKYKQGMVPLITLLDAQNDWSSAQMNKIISTYDLLIKEAQLIFVTAFNVE